MARIYFQTLGCRLNQAESERMAQGFVMAGHEVVEDENAADVRVVNTRTVTGEAGWKSRRAARSLMPGQRVVVTGCHSEVKPDDFESADLRVRNEDKEKLVSLTLEKFGMDGLALGMDYRSSGALKMYPLVLDHTRAFVKIQDGCNLRCSFCLTTVARGASHSRSPDAIVEEVQGLAAKGCQEAVLTGVHAGSYGVRDVDLGGLLERILTETTIPRLRLSSLEPWNFKFSWIDLWQRFPARLCPHLHMSLQSGSDSVLHRMRRPYNAAAYAEKINELKSKIENMAVTTDIIVGFPGETEEEHRASVAFAQHMKFSGAHVFTFSPRPGTDAATLPDQLSASLKKDRYQEMKQVAATSASAYRQTMVGKTLSVLWEELADEDSAFGLSENYLRVKGPRKDAARNQISSVRINGVEGEVLSGSLK